MVQLLKEMDEEQALLDQKEAERKREEREREAKRVKPTFVANQLKLLCTKVEDDPLYVSSVHSQMIEQVYDYTAEFKNATDERRKTLNKRLAKAEKGLKQFLQQFEKERKVLQREKDKQEREKITTQTKKQIAKANLKKARSKDNTGHLRSTSMFPNLNRTDIQKQTEQNVVKRKAELLEKKSNYTNDI